LFALQALLNALAPLVGAEAELGNKAVSAGWEKPGKKGEWSDKGVALVEELKELFWREYKMEFDAKMRQACCRDLVRVSVSHKYII
jgi:serine/tyrosine/threonine adenylyltransferase